MTREELIAELTSAKLITNIGRVSRWAHKKTPQYLAAEIEKHTSFLRIDANVVERIRMIQYDICNQGVCCVCGSDTKFGVYEFNKTCSRLCADELGLKNRTTTLLERYNTTCFITTLSKDQQSANGKKANVKSKEAVFAKYGVHNVMHIPEVAAKVAAVSRLTETILKKNVTLIANYGSLEEYQRQKREKLKQCEYSERDNKKHNEYIDNVMYFTRLADKSSLADYEKRGRLDANPEAYHLDHIVSKNYGFLNNIHPSIIGDINNLRMIPGVDNISKLDRCDMTIGTLFAMIEISSSINILNKDKD